jgi:hypothetical protein
MDWILHFTVRRKKFQWLYMSTYYTVSVPNPVFRKYFIGIRILGSANLKYGPDPDSFVGNRIFLNIGGN